MKKWLLIFLCTVMLVSVFAGCKKDVETDEGGTGKVEDENTVKDDGNNSTVSPDNEENGMELVDAKQSGSLTEANSKFALEIFKQLNKEDADSNVFISPFSISSALAMTLNGAEGTTREAMEEALSYQGISREELNAGYKYLLSRLKELDDEIALNIANSIWIRKDFLVKEEFIDLNREAFSAEVENMDFDNPETVEVINNWIDEATEGMISKMISPPIDQQTIMYLINAVYFKGQWTTEFDPEKTLEGQFKGLDNKKQSVQMMNRTGKTEFVDTDEYKAIRMPYGKEKMSMYCILPKGEHNINEWISAMTLETWNKIRQELEPVDDVIIKIPRFKMEYGIKELNQALINLGMGEAFSDSANFSSIAEALAISEVLHKAVIEVNEEGSEAAGTTVVGIKVTGIAEPIEFIADRPFMFAIADEEGNIFFMGKMASAE